MVSLLPHSPPQCLSLFLTLPQPLLSLQLLHLLGWPSVLTHSSLSSLGLSWGPAAIHVRLGRVGLVCLAFTLFLSFLDLSSFPGAGEPGRCYVYVGKWDRTGLLEVHLLRPCFLPLPPPPTPWPPLGASRGYAWISKMFTFLFRCQQEGGETEWSG